MIELLKDAGALIAVGGSVVYASVKLTEAGLAEVLNFVPGFGWLVSGLITASVTATVAVLWWWYCDYHARSGAIPFTAIRPQTAWRSSKRSPTSPQPARPTANASSPPAAPPSSGQRDADPTAPLNGATQRRFRSFGRSVAEAIPARR